MIRSPKQLGNILNTAVNSVPLEQHCSVTELKSERSNIKSAKCSKCLCKCKLDA